MILAIVLLRRMLTAVPNTTATRWKGPGERAPSRLADGWHFADHARRQHSLHPRALRERPAFAPSMPTNFGLLHPVNGGPRVAAIIQHPACAYPHGCSPT